MKPRLRQHARVHRHYYRDALWYVLQDDSSGRFYRFSSPVYQVIGLMDGERTVQDIWDAVTTQLGDSAPSQDEVIQLLGKLHAGDVLQCDVPPDSVELFRRFEKKSRSEWKQRLLSPLLIKFPLVDPERLLERALPLISPLFSWIGALVWLLVVCGAAVLAASHWPELTDNLADRALAPQNLVMLVLIYPFMKLLHELGHAFATKIWGGEVHEMGITLLALMPIPYVDCSAASAFLDKRQRMLVGSAGIIVEIFLAAVALFVWLNVEPGIMRDVAFNVVLIGSVSTVFFNGNPLLRFDGYYVLADAIEIPNLATRSKKYLAYLFIRYIFGVREVRSPVTAPGERSWFIVYGVASLIYRLCLMFFIIYFIAGKFFILGLILAAWIIVVHILLPLLKQLFFILLSPEIRRHRARAVSATALMIFVVVGVTFFLPVPSRTLAEGVVWLPEQSQVRVGIDGTVVRVLATPGSKVRRGDPLFETEDPFLPVNVKVIESQLQELSIQYEIERQVDRVRAENIQEEMAAVKADLAEAKERLNRLIIHSPIAGTFIVPEAADLPGRFFRKGELLGYVTKPAPMIARVVVRQGEFLLVRQRTRNVEAKLTDRLGTSVPAVIRREVPAANYLLPSKVLGATGGGRIAVDHRDDRGTKALEKIFQIDVELLGPIGVFHLGKRVHVLFDHGKEPLANQLYRSIQRLLLGFLLSGAGV